MKVLHSALDEGFVQLKVTASPEDVDRAFEIATINFCNQMSIHRDGDKSMAQCAAEQRGLKDLDAVVAPSAAEALVPLAIDKSDFFPAYVPKGDFGTKRIARGKSFSFEITLPLKAAYSLDSYEPVTVEVAPYGNDEAATREQMKAMIDNYKEYEDVSDDRAIASGDAALLKVECFHEGETVAGVTTEGRTYVAGTGAMPEEFDKNVIGMKPGEKKEFSFTLQEMDPQGNPTDETYDCTVEVKTLQREKDVELTDEWVEGHMPPYKTVDEWRASVGAAVSAEHHRQYDDYVRNVVAGELAKRVQGIIPDDVYEATMKEMLENLRQQVSMQGMPWDAFVAQNGGEQQLQMQVMTQTRITLMQCYALDAVYAHEHLNASEQDLLDVCTQINPANPNYVRSFMEEQGYGFSLRESAQRLCANKWAAAHANVTERAEEN